MQIHVLANPRMRSARRIKAQRFPADSTLVTRARLRRTATSAACVAWMAGGLGVLMVLAPGVERPVGTDRMFAAACMLLALAFGFLRRTFRTREQQFDLSPVTGIAVLAAVALAPPWAALVGLIAVIGDVRRRRSPLERAFVAVDGAFVAGVASILASALLHRSTLNGSILITTVLVAATYAALSLFGRVLLAEARSAGGGTRLLRGTPTGPILLVQTALPVATVAVCLPWFDRPAVAVLAVIAWQLVTWRLLAILHSDHAGSADRDALRETFERYVPSHVADDVLERSGSSPGARDAARRDLSVLFVDVRGFTTWAEQADAADVLGELTQLLDGVADAITATGGTIDKFTGDGLMAFWNAPLDQPDHARRAVRALPVMLMRLHELNLRREAQRSEPLAIGIGLATGSAMVGEIGHGDRLAYTAIGDVVNLAARLEKATREHDLPCLIDESTFLQLPHEMQRQMTRLGVIDVKGRRERVRIYAPTTLVHQRDGVRPSRSA